MKPAYRNTILILALFILVYFLADFLSEKYFIHTSFNGCIECHDEMEGFENSHSPEIVGCNACHLGNPSTTNKFLAHKDMIPIPGNLSNASRTCGVTNCHPGIPERVNSSIMSTMSGVISVNRFAFDELEKPEGFFHVKDLTQSNADNHNRNLCASCHLGNEKTEFGAIEELSRGGGCNACHLNYSNEAIEQLKLYQNSKLKIQKSKKEKDLTSQLPKVHPQLNLNISNDHCFGCHSRSGRIATNYEGWFETLFTANEVEGKNGYRLLMDGRVFQKTKDDVHHQKGMECIDCHVSMEIMGDGNSYNHMEEQVQIQCTDCHSKENHSISYNELDFESKKIVNLRNSQKENEMFLITEKSGIPLINTYVSSSNQKYLITKSKKEKLSLNPPAFICSEGKAHNRLSCNSCHTEWVSHCVGCHTEFNPTEEGYDLLDNKDIVGSWIETPSDFYIDYPVLGVRKEKSGKEVIDTFIPGMVITIDKMKNASGKKIFKRLFAPTFSHTINKKGRSCKSCHNNSLALGYGKGKLVYVAEQTQFIKGTEFVEKGRWNFIPQFANHKEDNLPKDAWVGFLQSRNETSTTRLNTRPFNIIEQKRILTVGACLTCHEENSEIMKESLYDYEKLLKRISQKCVLP